MKYLLILTMALSIQGCESYKFGDGTKAVLTLIEMRLAYCSSVNDAERESLLEMIRLADPDYEGICPE